MLKDIFEYHHHFNQKLIDEIKKHSSTLPERTFPLFCHVLNAHQIWNARISGGIPFADRMQIIPIETCAEIDQSNYQLTLKILEATDLNKLVTYKTSAGAPFTNTVQDILIHVANHSAHHKGQIISDFRQSGIAPLVTDYIFYKREQSSTR